MVKTNPSLEELIHKYAHWRHYLETILDSRPKSLNLEHFSQYLVEFEHQKFDEVEVPGQYQRVSLMICIRFTGIS